MSLEFLSLVSVCTATVQVQAFLPSWMIVIPSKPVSSSLATPSSDSLLECCQTEHPKSAISRAHVYNSDDSILLSVVQTPSLGTSLSGDLTLPSYSASLVIFNIQNILSS